MPFFVNACTITSIRVPDKFQSVERIIFVGCLMNYTAIDDISTKALFLLIIISHTLKFLVSFSPSGVVYVLLAEKRGLFLDLLPKLFVQLDKRLSALPHLSCVVTRSFRLRDQHLLDLLLRFRLGFHELLDLFLKFFDLLLYGIHIADWLVQLLVIDIATKSCLTYSRIHERLELGPHH